MKKSILLFIAFATLEASGQPILQQNNPPDGFTANINIGVGVSPGPAGASQTWNFSTAVVANAGAYTVMNCASTPCFSSFPLADWCFSIPGPKYKYFNSTSSILEQLANDIPTSCSGGATYSNTRTILTFPFNYTNSLTDTWASATSSGSITSTYDGYGTLITPFATYPSVARVTSSDGTSTSTIWYNINPLYQVMTIDFNNNTIILSNEVMGTDEISRDNAVSVFPNPSTDGVFSFMQKNGVFETEMQMEISNILGDIVHHVNLNAAKTEVKMTSAAKGIYFYKITSKGNFVDNGKLIVQ